MLYQKCVRFKDQTILGLRVLVSKFSIYIYIVLSTQVNYFSKAEEGQLQHSHIIKVDYFSLLSKDMYIERVVFLILT